MFDSLRNIILKLLILLIPFQAWKPFGSIYLNATFVMFFLYFGLSLFNLKKYFQFIRIKPFFIPFACLWVLMFIMTTLNDFPEARTTYSVTRQILMQFFFFWLVVNDLYRNPNLGSSLLKTFIISMTIMATLLLLNVGVEISFGRKTIFEYNANMLAMWFVLAAFIILRILIEKEGKKIFRIFLVIVLLIFLKIIADTGSRSAFFALMLGPVIYMLLMPRNRRYFYLNYILGFLLLFIMGYLIYSTDIMQERIVNQIEDPTFGGRKLIWDNTIVTIKDHLWLGQGASGFEKNLKERMGMAWSPHNEYLSILAYTGLVGFLFFLVFLVKIGRGAYLWRTNYGSPFYFSLYIVFLAFFNISGSYIASFVLWFFWALMVSLPVNEDSILQPHYLKA